MGKKKIETLASIENAKRFSQISQIQQQIDETEFLKELTMHSNPKLQSKIQEDEMYKRFNHTVDA